MADPTQTTGWTGTAVDLGDDLLQERTRVLGEDARVESEESVARARTSDPLSAIPSGPLSADQISDLLQSAKILQSEGFTEDAKRVLRKIILADPSQVNARKKLEEIHELELTQIFQETEARRTFEWDETDALPKFDSDSVMRSLDRDLELGIFGDGETVESLALEKRVFGGADQMEKFAKDLENSLGASTPRDRLDLGVAFFEMELFELAARQFQAAAHDPALKASATTMQATSMIQMGRSFEAMLLLEPLIGETNIPREEKIEYMYLMGRASERLRKTEAALHWYKLVRDVDPYYRDTEDRYKYHCEEKLRNR